MNQNSAASKSRKLQYHNFLQLVSKYLSKKLILVSKKFSWINSTIGQDCHSLLCSPQKELIIFIHTIQQTAVRSVLLLTMSPAWPPRLG